MEHVKIIRVVLECHVFVYLLSEIKNALIAGK